MIDIDAERVRVEKEAGEVSAYQYRYKTWSGSWSEWVSCDESTVRALQSSKHREDHETRALVVQNSASNPLSPGEYFRCDECHEPAGLRQVCRRCVRLEIERDDAGEPQTSAVKVPDGLIEALHRQRQVDEDGSECGVSRQAVEEAISILQSLTKPTETPR